MVTLKELAALHALGALDARDQEEFRDLYARASEDERREITDYEIVAALFGLSQQKALTPSPSVKHNLMQQIQQANEGSRARGFEFILAHEGEWHDHPVTGVRFKQLSLDKERGYATLLMKVEPGTRYPEHEHTGPEECYVLEGDLHVGGRTLGPGDFHHADADTHHGVLHTEKGCTLLLVVAAKDYLPS